MIITTQHYFRHMRVIRFEAVSVTKVDNMLEYSQDNFEGGDIFCYSWFECIFE